MILFSKGADVYRAMELGNQTHPYNLSMTENVINIPVHAYIYEASQINIIKSEFVKGA